MTPLEQLVDALMESADPVLDLVDGTHEARLLLSATLAPLEQLYAARDLLVATAVLEAITPLLADTTLLLAAPPVGRPV